MNNVLLEETLLEKTTALCESLAQDPQVVAAKAVISLFTQDQTAIKLFEEVNQYGEELRNKHLAGMPPTEEEIAKFDELRQGVVQNETARGFLEARQQIDTVLGTISQFLGMSIDMGRAPTLAEVQEARKQSAQGGCGCGCGDGECGDNCDCGDDCKCN